MYPLLGDSTYCMYTFSLPWWFIINNPYYTMLTPKMMDVKLAARSAAKSEQGIIDYNLAVPHRILIKFETEHYERGSFVPF